MKIIQISVKKLFDAFNHTIQCNRQSGITIVIGENGLGKTVILEMVDAFFNKKFFYFNSVNFEELKFIFDDGIQWILDKKEERHHGPTILNLTQINKNGTQYKPIQFSAFRAEHSLPFFEIARRYPFIERIGSDRWIDRRDGVFFNRAELEARFAQEVIDYDSIATVDRPKWFTDRHNEINVNLIKTQRLISIDTPKRNTHKQTVEKYSEELSLSIKGYLTESTELSSKLDRTYPNRLVNILKLSSNVTDDDLKVQLAKLEEKRALLDRVGLIEIEKDSNILEIEKPSEVIKDVLMLYVEDSFKKIEIFDDIAKKIQIFMGIINKRFKHKEFYVDKEKGFQFRSTIVKDNEKNYQMIPVSKLSSGEQNELVLFYELLFKPKTNSLILIDEPEVSLHISWQNNFIKDLKVIAELNNLEVIIATHSPDIIDNNWDLKVELKGLE